MRSSSCRAALELCAGLFVLRDNLDVGPHPGDFVVDDPEAGVFECPADENGMAIQVVREPLLVNTLLGDLQHLLRQGNAAYLAGRPRCPRRLDQGMAGAETDLQDLLARRPARCQDATPIAPTTIAIRTIQ